MQNVFWGNAPTANTTRLWYEFDVPDEADMLFILAHGSGAAGGGAGASAAATAAGGGKGGGSGALTKLLIPTMLLPKRLYVSPGNGTKGGTGQVRGGAAATDGQAGNSSYVTLTPSIDDANNTSGYVIKSGQTPATGGQAGSGATAGSTGGAAETICSVASAPITNMGLMVSLAGQAGANGGSAAAGSDLTNSSNNPMANGGPGGGGVNAGTTVSRGGQITSLFPFTFPSQPSTAGANGVDGYTWSQMLDVLEFWPGMSSSGNGGTANTSNGVGGKGGQAGPGCGGPGGGASNGASSIGGAGGDGGKGFVIIIAF
jgi:hypothetical protein